MRSSSRLALAPASLSVVLLAAACSGNAGTSAPGALPATVAGLQRIAPQVASPAASTSFVYGCTGEPKCFVYDLSGKRVRTLSTGFIMPQGLAADPQGNVYLADEFAQDIAV